MLESRPRILFLAPRLPWPLDTGGKIRTYHLLRGLARRHEVRLLAIGDGDDGATAGLAGLGVRVEVVRPPGKLRSLLAAGLGLVGPVPATVMKYQRLALAARVAALVRRREVDLVHCDHLHMALYGALARRPFVIDEHNVETVIWERLARDRSEPALRRLIYREQAFWLRRLEARLCRHAALVLVCSAVDRGVLQSLAGPRLAETALVPNGVDVEYFSEPGPVDGSAGGPRLVFTGSMDWAPNENAALAFVDEIWPRVRHTLGDGARFYIVGRNPSARLRGHAVAGEVVVTGTVADVRPFLRGSLALVVPMRVGGGTRLKILEAFAAGVPVISTAVGIEGIEATAGVHYLAAEDAGGFAACARRLRAEPALRAALTAAAFELARERYSWSSVGDSLAREYERRFARA